MENNFSVRIGVRDYEIDASGHVSALVYQQWAHFASMACIRHAGTKIEALAEQGLAPIDLEVTTRFHRELRLGDEVDVGCIFEWSSGRTYRMTQEIRKPDGTLVAEVNTLGAVLDLARRRMIANPAERLQSITDCPERLGLSTGQLATQDA
ncbi:acyl-CoA thioester hydrolase [Mycobacterium sp. MAA66]|uniref:acyl-CoA thioesterase n=1 Tax=Mycobacterium sp. MAA66 TaxID=3156297 RepID=UPI0035166BCA